MSCRTRAWVVAYQDQRVCSSRSELAEFGDREDEAADSTLDARRKKPDVARPEVSKHVSGVSLRVYKALYAVARSVSNFV